MECGYKLYGQSILLGSIHIRALLDFVIHLHEFVAARAVSNCKFVGLGPGKGRRPDIAEPRGNVPSGRQNHASFAVPCLLDKRRYRVIVHMKSLPFSLKVPMSETPLHIGSETGGGQMARAVLTREIIWKLMVQVWATIGGNSDAQALANGVARASRPICILIVVENASRIRRRRIRNLISNIEFAECGVQLDSGQAVRC